MSLILPDYSLEVVQDENRLEEIYNEGKVNLSELNQELLKQFKELNNTNLEKPELSELIPAVPTLFTENNEIDYLALENRFKDYKEAGIVDVLIAGTTGLSSLMGEEEQLQYIKKSVKMGEKYGLKIVAGTGSNNTKEQNILTYGAFENGAQASLLLAPYYLKASEGDLLRHLFEGLNKGPGIIYSISGRTGIQISLEILKLLSEHPNFVGVKECDGEDRIKELSECGIKVWSGNDDEVLSNTNSGAYGTITVAGNLAPSVVQELITKQSVSDNTQKVSDLVNFLMFLPGEPNPKGISNIYSMIEKEDREKYTPGFRMPTGPITKAQQEFVKKQLKILGINSKEFGNDYRFFN